MELDVALTAVSLLSFVVLILGWVALPQSAAVQTFRAPAEAQPAAA